MVMGKSKNSIFHRANVNESKTKSSTHYTRRSEMAPTNSKLPFGTLRVKVRSFLLCIECHSSGPHHMHRKVLKYLLYIVKIKVVFHRVRSVLFLCLLNRQYN